jgi:hypothetical protein
MRAVEHGLSLAHLFRRQSGCDGVQTIGARRLPRFGAILRKQGSGFQSCIGFRLQRVFVGGGPERTIA